MFSVNDLGMILMVLSTKFSFYKLWWTELYGLMNHQEPLQQAKKGLSGPGGRKPEVFDSNPKNSSKTS